MFLYVVKLNICLSAKKKNETRKDHDHRPSFRDFWQGYQGPRNDEEEDDYHAYEERMPRGQRRGREDEDWDNYDRGVKLPRPREKSEDRYHRYPEEEDYQKSSSSRDHGRDRQDIRVVRDEEGNSKVQLDYDTWKKIREFVVLADKYVEEYFRFRLLRAKNAKTYRNRKNKDMDVGQASGRGNGWNKGPGVN